MSDYAKTVNYSSKDSLPTGNPLKIVRGTELDNEFNAIVTAVASKADKASPTFTGTPAAPTAAVGTRTTQLATTEMFGTEFAKSIGANGYQKLPGGLILQWGQGDMGAGTSVAVTWPLAFPTACLHASGGDVGGTVSIGTVGNPTTTGVTFQGSSTPGIFHWFAIGY